MKKNTIGYQMSEQDVVATIKYLQATEDKDATREDAIEFLDQHKSMAHIAAHKIVEQEKK